MVFTVVSLSRDSRCAISVPRLQYVARNGHWLIENRHKRAFTSIKLDTHAGGTKRDSVFKLRNLEKGLQM